MNWKSARTKTAARRAPTVLLLLMLAALLCRAVLDLPRQPRGLTASVNASIEASGVEHPVTAVLLNFRSYDTWLELGVLLLAAMGMLCVQRISGLRDVQPGGHAQPVLAWLTRFTVPMMLLLAGYLLWIGKSAPGGAFQSGVVLGAATVLMWLGGYRSVARLAGWFWRGLLLLGFAAFYAAAMALALAGHRLLEFPRAWAGALILLIETAAAISIGLVLASLFIGPQSNPASASRAPDNS
jgi:multisubunit Na+/H+ antiporter MnhB subunit